MNKSERFWVSRLEDKKSKINISTVTPFKDDDANKKVLVKLWGNSLNKLTPKQRQLVVEILSNLEPTALEA